jgi:hypothetical protein
MRESSKIEVDSSLSGWKERETAVDIHGSDEC